MSVQKIKDTRTGKYKYQRQGEKWDKDLKCSGRDKLYNYAQNKRIDGGRRTLP